jgi:hypothetical protein
MSNKVVLDEKRLDAIRERLKLTTLGPWVAYIEGKNHESGSSCIGTGIGGIDLDGATDADIEFMAHARQDIPYLLAELERLKAESSG